MIRQILWQAASYVAIFIAAVAWVGWGDLRDTQRLVHRHPAPRGLGETEVLGLDGEA